MRVNTIDWSVNSNYGVDVTLWGIEYKAYLYYKAIIGTIRDLSGIAVSYIQKQIKSLTQWYLFKKYGKRTTALGEIVPNSEYYRDYEGKIRVRAFTGIQGRWQVINGKEVKISDETPTLDIYTIIPWKESNAGYYDETLEQYIGSKDDYRHAMKAKGYIPKESTRYSKKSQAVRRQELASQAAAKRRDQVEKAYAEALQRVGDNIAIED